MYSPLEHLLPCLKNVFLNLILLSFWKFYDFFFSMTCLKLSSLDCCSIRSFKIEVIQTSSVDFMLEVSP